MQKRNAKTQHKIWRVNDALVLFVVALPAAAAEAVAEALDDTDDGDAQEEGHQSAQLCHKLKS